MIYPQRATGIKVSKFNSKGGFWNKVKTVAKIASIKAVHTALMLYYALDFMPIEKKAIIIGALGHGTGNLSGYTALNLILQVREYIYGTLVI